VKEKSFRSDLRSQTLSLHVGLITSDLSHRHGWAHYSLSLLDALRRAGVRVTVVTARNTPDVEDVELHRLLPNTFPAERGLLLKMMRVVPQIAQVLRDCDVLHATIEPYAPLGMWIAGSRPLFVTAHGSYIPILLRRHWPASNIYRRAFTRARIICVSQYTERVIQNLLPTVYTSVVTHGINFERFATLRSLETPKTAPTVLFVGAVKRRKGALELVQAMAHVPDAQCVMIGNLDAEPDYTTLVRTEIKRLNLEDRVHLLGHVPESTLLGWYGAADVFALPSLNSGDKFEGYGLVHLEASAAGLPVIGTCDCGAEDAIIDGVTGFLIPQSGVVDALAEAIGKLLSDPERAQGMGAAGRKRAQGLTWDSVANDITSLYRGGR
jgi:phosphatidyl-myo-inositol dimannoside synthase